MNNENRTVPVGGESEYVLKVQHCYQLAPLVAKIPGLCGLFQL